VECGNHLAVRADVYEFHGSALVECASHAGSSYLSSPYVANSRPCTSRKKPRGWYVASFAASHGGRVGSIDYTPKKRRLGFHLLGSHPLLPSPTAALVPLAEDSRSASRALLQAKYPATAAAASLSALSATIVHVGGPLICEYSLPYWKYTPPAPMTIATAIRASMFMWRGT
jgi:hypothetical protein